MRWFSILLFCVAACSPTDAIQGDPARVSPEPIPSGQTGESGAFRAMTGALTLQIETSSGPLEVRLAEIDTPVPQAAQSQLADWLEGRQVQLVYSGLRRDRYDRALAQVRITTPVAAASGELGEEASTTSGHWLQYRLVEAGLARVMTHGDNQAHASVLLAVEQQARQAGRGLWGDPDHRVRDTHPDARAQDIGSAQIVEGRVLDAVQLNSGRIYLNFGSDYRSDFTVRIDAADSAVFEAAGLVPDMLSGRRVRVRGWLTDENGPMIQLDHPARLELLEEDPEAAIAR